MFTPWKLTKPAEISQYMCIFFAKYTHVVTGYVGAFYSFCEFSWTAPVPKRKKRCCADLSISNGKDVYGVAGYPVTAESKMRFKIALRCLL